MLVRRILDLDPLRRITLMQLKREIANIETFFMSDDEIADATKQVQEAAAMQSPVRAASPAVLKVRNYNNERYDSRAFLSGSGIHDLVERTETLSTVSLSSGGGTEDSGERPKTPEGISIPARCVSPTDNFHNSEKEIPTVRTSKRPPLKTALSTKCLKHNAARTLQAVKTRLRAL